MTSPAEARAKHERHAREHDTSRRDFGIEPAGAAGKAAKNERYDTHGERCHAS